MTERPAPHALADRRAVPEHRPPARARDARGRARPATRGAIAIRGRLLDGEGAPVPDGMIETWQANAAGRYRHPADDRGDVPLEDGFLGFGRCGTTADGEWRIVTVKPGRVPAAGGGLQAPHLAVSVFARGLLKRARDAPLLPRRGRGERRRPAPRARSARTSARRSSRSADDGRPALRHPPAGPRPDRLPGALDDGGGPRAHAGRDRRRRPGRPAPVASCSQPRASSRWSSSSAAATTASPACAPASSSTTSRRSSTRSASASACAATASSTRASSCSSTAAPHRIDFMALTGRTRRRLRPAGADARPRSSTLEAGRPRPALRGRGRRRARPSRPTRRGSRSATAAVATSCAATSSPAATASTASAATRSRRRAGATYSIALPVRLARHPRARRAGHRRARLLLARARLRPLLAALATRSRGSTCRWRPTSDVERLARRARLGRARRRFARAADAALAPDARRRRSRRA